jgi:transposase
MSEVIREVLAREAALQAAVRVGVDLAKRVIQVHAVDRAGKVLATRSLPREKFEPWCAQLPAGCIVAMETCSGAHHWGRRLRLRGLDVRLVAGHFVTPYRMQGRRGKNDANDAAAICEAASRPHMRFVPVKSAEQQGWLAVHRLREGFKEERTACINRIRGLLAEFGLVFPQRPELLRQALPAVLDDMNNELPDIGRLALQQALLHWIELDCHLAWCDERVAVHARTDARARAVMPLAGIGPVTASALVASVDDFEQFDDARQFGSWLGLTPSQSSTGGKARLGRITKRGDQYLRTLLIQAARSAVFTAHQRSDRLSRWLLALRERRGWQKAAVALANKNARIVWAILTRGECFDADHMPEVPATKQAKPRATVPAAAPAMTGTPVMAG